MPAALVKSSPATPKAKFEAMPGLVMKSVSIPPEVIDDMLKQEEAKAGTIISKLAEHRNHSEIETGSC